MSAALLNLQARLERDRDVMQLQRSLDTLQQGSQREAVDLQTQVDRLQRAKETAEVRTAGLEETVRQQEQLLTSMRWAARDTQRPLHSVTCCWSDAQHCAAWARVRRACGVSHAQEQQSKRAAAAPGV